MQTKAATIVLIPHNDVERTCRRLSRDIVPSLRHYGDWRFELVIIDNSERRMDQLADAVAALPWPSRYIWHDGVNLFYGPALNAAANLAEHPVLLYACANHGRMIDPGWIRGPGAAVLGGRTGRHDRPPLRQWASGGAGIFRDARAFSHSGRRAGVAHRRHPAIPLPGGAVRALGLRRLAVVQADGGGVRPAARPVGDLGVAGQGAAAVRGSTSTTISRSSGSTRPREDRSLR